MDGLFTYFTFVFDWVNALQLLAVSVSIVLVLGELGTTKRKLLRSGIEVVAVFAVETILNWLLFYLSHYLSFLAGINFPLAHFFTVVIYVIFFSKYRLKSRLVMGATVFVTAIIMAEFSKQLFNSFGTHPNLDSLLYGIFGDVLIVAFAVLMRLRSIRRFDDIPGTSVLGILVVSACSTVLDVKIILNSIRDGMHPDTGACYMLAYIYIVTVAVYIITYYYCTEHNEKVVLAVDKKLMEADMKMLSVSEQLDEEMRELRHDIKNQYLVMDVMLKEGRYDDMAEYFKNMKKEFTGFPHFTDCGNAAINSIMNLETLKAASNHIQIISKIDVPAELPVTVNDLCRVLVNLLDNAMEAVVKTVGDRIVDLSISVRGNYLVICVVNVISKDVDRGRLKMLITTKDDARRHGYGHRIIKRIVEKYNGYVNYSIEGDEFIAEVMLDMQKEQNNGKN